VPRSHNKFSRMVKKGIHLEVCHEYLDQLAVNLNPTLRPLEDLTKVSHLSSMNCLNAFFVLTSSGMGAIARRKLTAACC
jgi:hypothetical protein